MVICYSVFSFPYSAVNGVDYEALSNEREDLVDELIDDPTNTEITDRIGEIDQERFKWLEFYKIKFGGEWYVKLIGNLVLRPKIKMEGLWISIWIWTSLPI